MLSIILGLRFLSCSALGPYGGSPQFPPHLINQKLTEGLLNVSYVDTQYDQPPYSLMYRLLAKWLFLVSFQLHEAKKKKTTPKFPNTSKTRGQSLSVLQAVGILFMHNNFQPPGYIQSALAAFLIFGNICFFFSSESIFNLQPLNTPIFYSCKCC